MRNLKHDITNLFLISKRPLLLARKAAQAYVQAKIYWLFKENQFQNSGNWNLDRLSTLTKTYQMVEGAVEFILCKYL